MGSDDGFRFRVHDGTEVRNSFFDSNRSFATGPLLAVTFPVEGGEFPFELLFWENSGSAGVEFSWAPGTETTFNASVFSLVPASAMRAPELEATQLARTLSNAPLTPGTEVEFLVDLRNNGSTPAWDIRFTPQTNGYTFQGYDLLPPGATQDGNSVVLASPLAPGERMELRYRMVIGAGFSSTQGSIRASTSPIANVGANRIRLRTNDPRYDGTTATANRPEGLFPGLGVRDDDPNLFAAGGLFFPPDLSVSTPIEGSVVTNRRPTFAGQSDGDTTVVILRNGEPFATVTTDGDGDFIYNPSTDLPLGSSQFEFYAVDDEGNRSDSIFRTIVVGPLITVESPTTGTVTNDSSPLISGTADPGQEVIVEIQNSDGDVIFTENLTAGVDGQWTLTAPVLPDGIYTIIASVEEEGVPNEDFIFITIDTVPPSLTLATPLDGAQTNEPVQTIEGTSDAGQDVVITITDGSGNVVFTETMTADGSGVYMVTSPSLGDGDYTITAAATDSTGNTASLSVGITVDTVAPVLTLTAPIDGAETNEPVQTITGTSDAGQDVVITITDGSGAVVFTETVTATGSGVYTATSPSLDDGDYTVTASATDSTGNTASSSVGITIDTVAPALTITTPVDGAASNQPAQTIEGTTDPGQEVVVTITDGSGTVVFTETVTADGSGEYTVTSSDLGDGDYTVTASATDSAGNTASSSVGITIDTVAPALTITTPVDGAASNQPAQTIEGTTDPGQEVVVTITDGSGTVVFTETVTADGSGGYTVTSSDLGDGDYTVTASATDSFGNSTSSSVDISIDTVAPALVLETPAEGLISSDPVQVLSGTSDPGQEVLVVLTDENGDTVFTETVTTDATGAWETQSSSLDNGSYTITVTAEDEAGNTSSVSHTFQIDLSLPMLVVDSPEDELLTNNGEIEVTGSTDPGATVTITVLNEDDEIIATPEATLNADGSFEALVEPALEDGTYTVVVTSTGANGESVTITREVAVDTTPPTATITRPGDGAVVSSANPVVEGTTEPGAEVEIYLDGELVGTVTADEEGRFEFELSGPLDDGAYVVEVIAIDEAGNVGEPVEVSFTVDRSAPDVVITSPSQGDRTDNTPVITGTSAPGTEVEIFINGELVATVVADGEGNFSYTVEDPLDDGQYTVEAITTGASGAQGSSGTITFEVYTPAPVIITSPSEGDSVTGPTITVEGTGEPGSTVTVTIGDKTETATVDDDGNWSVVIEDVPEGPATIEVTTDTGESFDVITIDVIYEDPDGDGDGDGLDPEDEGFLSGGGVGCASTNGSLPGGGLLLLVIMLLVAKTRGRKRI